LIFEQRSSPPHVSDVAVDEVAEPARRAGAAVKAGQEILVIGYARPERRRTSADRGANLCPCQVVMLI
jgi:hypothetical protein